MRKGYVFYLEMIFIVLLLLAILTLFPSQRPEVVSAGDDLAQLGFSSMVALGREGVFDAYITSSGINATAIDAYVAAELPDSLKFKMEYYNTSGCIYPTECGAANITATDIQTAYYTHSKLMIPVTVKMYLWEVFG